MLLRSLVRAAATLDLPPPGYARRYVRWSVELDGEGEPRLQHLRDLDDGDPVARGRGLALRVPDVQRSGVQPQPFLLVDTLEYALGVAKEPNEAKQADAERRHRAFVELARRAAEAIDNAALQAVMAFLARPRIDIPPVAKPSDRVVFAVDGVYVHDLPDVVEFWQTVVSGRKASGRRGLCLVCGADGALADTIPSQLPIGVVPEQGNQLALVSMNVEAQGRNGETGLRNTPICTSCASASIAVLSFLLTAEGHHRCFASSRSSLAWWLTSGREFDPYALLDRPGVDDPQHLFDALAAGRPTDGSASVEFHAVLGSASTARFVVRRWIDRSLADVYDSVERWFDDHRIASSRDGAEIVLPLWQLASATGAWDRSRKHPGAAAFGVEDALAVAAIEGTRLPARVLPTLLARLRADRHVTDARAALLRLALRRSRLATEETTMPGLNPDSTDAAYVCGRLLAVIDALQHEALGDVGAGIADRMLGRASTAPASIFPRVLADSRAYVKKLRRAKPAAAVALDRRIDELAALLDARGFPAALTVPEQGRFYLGFHHQRARDAAARHEAAAARSTSPNTPTGEEQVSG